MVRELVHHGYHVRACIRDASSWRGKDSVDYLSRLANVDVIDGCDLFTRGSYDDAFKECVGVFHCLLYTSPSPRDRQKSRMPSSA